MKKGTPTQKEFEAVVVGGESDTEYMLHRITSLLRKMNRDGKVEDWEFANLHSTIEMVYRKTK